MFLPLSGPAPSRLHAALLSLGTAAVFGICRPAQAQGETAPAVIPPVPVSPASAAQVAAAQPPVAAKPGDTTLPPVTVTGRPYQDERPVGKYRQPEWTTERRFANSRAYVLPKGMIELEQWWRGTYKRGGTKADRFLTEIGAGLGSRLQLDTYGRFEGETGEAVKYVGEQFELRYAFADWGKLPGNPTAYLEFKNNHGDAAHVAEGKLLFSDQFKRGWHWAVNLSYEQELGGVKEIERAVTFGVGKTLKDSKLSVGLEGALERVTAHGSASETALLLGPSIQWRPTRYTHLDVVPLFGVTHDAPTAQIFVVFGVNLRQGEKSVNSAPRPVSSKSR